jgi:hypothetical protein
VGASDDLIAVYWTTSGPVEIHTGREWSLFDLRDRCEQAARVGFKIHRFEVVVAVLASIVVTVTAAIVILHLNEALALVPAGCFDAWFSSSGDDVIATGCDAPMTAFFALEQAEAGRVMAAMWVLPFAVGLLLGVPLIGHELETRTAETAWTLAGSRRRWLAYLAVPVIVLVVVALGIAAATAEALASARQPWMTDGPGWQDIGLYGPIVVARGAAAFGIGLLSGAVVGRVLPALTTAIVACGLLLFLLVGARHEWMVANQVELDGRNGYVAGGEIMTGQMYVDPSGEVLRPDEAFARIPSGLSDEEATAWMSANMREVYYGVPASAVPAWERLEVLGLAAGSILLIAASFVVVERRRPR